MLGNNTPSFCMISKRRILAELIATPARCFMWALILILLGGSLGSPFIVLRKKLDSAGMPMFREDGTPIKEVDTLADILAHWPENLCLLGAVIFAGIGLLICWLRLRDGRTPRMNPTMPNNEHRTPDPP
jgi:uncharacterized membrane protein SpoIIM required for sporulation